MRNFWPLLQISSFLFFAISADHVKSEDLNQKNDKEQKAVEATIKTFRNQENIMAELSKEQSALLGQGQVVHVRKEIDGLPLPLYSFYQIIDVPAAEAFKTYSDFNDQKNYIPALTKSQIITKIDSENFLVDFEMDLPWPISNAEYRNRIYLTSTAGSFYQVYWEKVTSNVAKWTYGSARFQQLADGKTLFAYNSLVAPQNFLASFLKDKMSSDLQKTFIIIGAHLKEVESQKNHRANSSPSSKITL